MKKINKTLIKNIFPLRNQNSHKTQSGKVFILAGSKNMAGAAVLAAKACYRAGAGLVSIAVPKDIYPAVLKAVPSALIVPLNEKGFLTESSVKTIKSYLKVLPHDVLLIGPGLDKGARCALKLLSLKIPSVLDADALNYLAKNLSVLKKDFTCILTPHEGEMKRLLGGRLPKDAAKVLGDKTGAVCLLKGPETKVYYKGGYYANTTGNEGLAKAGSGDTLAGIIAALLAQNLKKEDKLPSGQKALNAALCGVYLHGLAADISVKKFTTVSLMPQDVEESIPQAVKKIFNNKV